MSDERELIRAVKDLKAMRRGRSLNKVLGAFGKLVPKGIRHPDSLITNLHLYKPGVKGKTRLR